MVTRDNTHITLKKNRRFEMADNPRSQATHASLHSLPQIEKLKGRENYVTWKFAMRASLELEDLWGCITEEEGYTADAKKVTRARSRIILAVDPINYVHIQDTTTAKQVWDRLESTFEDSGLTRKVGLLRTLVTTRLDNSESVDDYINTVITTAHKLNNLNLAVPDEWVGTLLLAGLPDEYRPMIMGIESSGIRITADSIKMKLLQDVKPTESGKNASSGSALYTKGKRTKTVRCFKCKKQGHYSTQCKSKPEKSKSEAAAETEDSGNLKKKDKAFVAFFSSGKSAKKTWYVDTCASTHITYDKEQLINTTNNTTATITAANNVEMSATAVGNAKIPVVTDNGPDQVVAKNVLYVPESSVNLLSVSKMLQKGYEVLFSPKGSRIVDTDGSSVATMTEQNGIFKLNSPNEKVYYTVKKPDAKVWHKRLGHLNNRSMLLLSKGLATGMNIQTCSEDPCVTCTKGKQQRSSFKESGKRAEGTLDIIHSDLCGPMETTSIGGARYFLTLIDDHTRKMFVYFLESKSQVAETFEEFQRLVENQTGKKIKVLRTDNGREYVNQGLKNILRKSGIRHQLTVPYCPEQNGLAERANRTIVERARSMLLDANLDKSFWAESTATAVYLINRSPTKRIPEMTPEEAWTGVKPNLEHLRVFGCKAMCHVPKERRQKWDPKSREMLFVGYCDETKGYRIMDPETKKITKARDVVFLEGMQDGEEPKHQHDREKQVNRPAIEEFYEAPVAIENDVQEEQQEHVEEEQEESTAESSNEEEFDDTLEDGLDSPDSEYEPAIEESEGAGTSSDSEAAAQVIGDPIPRRSSRAPKPIERKDFVTYLISDRDSDDPLTVKEAFGGPDKEAWWEAMREEYKSLLENETWDLTDLPKGKRALDTKWVFKTKRTESGNLERRKARLVVRGCKQVEGIDYTETYSPVIRYTSIRYLLALATKYDLHIDQMDVTTAYLNGDLDEEIYVRPPAELAKECRGKVWRLKKAMYGLKQSGKSWNTKLDQTLKSMGFIQSKADPCIYQRKEEKNAVIVAIYVDDMFVLSNDQELKNATKQMLRRNFRMKDLGEAKNFLGMRITRDRRQGKLRLDQETYIRDILKRFNMSDCKPVATPLDVNQKLTKEMEPKSKEEINEMRNIPYREAVGSLMYVCQGTRPDVAHAVSLVSRFNQNPGRAHWTAVKRIFRYLKGTANATLEFNKRGNQSIEGYSDADWANDETDRHSVTGSVFKLLGGPVSWQSKKQKTVALSTTEAEYMALAATCQEALWLRALAKELDPQSVEEPTMILCDNKGSVDLANTAGFRQRTKHIDIRHHFIREHLADKEIIVHYIPTEKMLADALTKALSSPKLKYCSNNLGVQY
jgi:transposase InsO family protein